MGLLIAPGFTIAVNNELGFGRAGLFLMIIAGCTLALALGTLAYLLRRSENWRAAALAFTIALLMSPLVYYLVRAPIEGPLTKNFGLAPFVLVLVMFSVPLTKEPAKWLAAAVPMVRRAIRSQPVTMALVVGLGFSVGETLTPMIGKEKEF